MVESHADKPVSAPPLTTSSNQAQPPILGMPPRQVVPAWVALVAVAGLAWVVTLMQARGMEVGPGTMGLTLAAFLALWVAMMVAMMLPAVAPMAILWVRGIQHTTSGVGWRVTRTGGFLLGYLLVWAAFGLVIYGLLVASSEFVERMPDQARWLAAGIYLVAGVYQFTPFKDACRNGCRSPLGQFLHYESYRGGLKDLRVGLHHGLYCVGCCWAFMLVLVATGAMNIAAMAILAAVIFVERLVPRYGQVTSRVVGVAFLIAAVLTPFVPGLLPGLHGGDMMSSGPSM